MEKQLPVKLNKQDLGDRVTGEILDPSTVTVRGRQFDLRHAEHLFTQPVNIEGKQANQPVTIEEHVPLEPQLSGRPLRVTPSVISVRFVLKPRQTLKELTEVPVSFLCPPNFPYRPEFVNEHGREDCALRARPGDGRSPRGPGVCRFRNACGKWGGGLHAEEMLQVELPPGFQLVGDRPRLSSFRLVPILNWAGEVH